MGELVAGRATPLEIIPPDLPDDSQYVQDGRAGVDRWGRPRKTLTACGTGWGDGEYICPLYTSEACPGERNPQARLLANRTVVCDWACGRCGGGDRRETINVCGQRKIEFALDWAIAEMGGSLRLDEREAPPGRVLEKWPGNFAPTVEWGGGKWLLSLRDGQWPVVATTLKTAMPPRRFPARTPLRDRLAGYQGFLLVNGLVTDDVIDDVWARLDDTIRFCKEETGGSPVDLMVSPQYSYY